MDYVLENQKILDEWKEAFIKNGGDINTFGEDGIMNRGDFEQENGEDSLWTQKVSGNENELWINCKLRILFLTKEQNLGDEYAWDVRKESYHSKNSWIEDYKPRFNIAIYRNLLRTLYGLSKTKPKLPILFEDLSDDKVLEYTDSLPYARINCKKEGGGKECDENKFNEFITKYSEFLKRQISNIDADIIVCCGSKDGKNAILDFILNSKIYDFKCVSYGIWYDKKNNKIAIDAYHPSYIKNYYNETVIESYYNFIKKYPDFVESHRKN